MSELTELQKEILITARDRPNATQSEIADMCDCSASYVSDVLNRFDSVDAFHAELEGISSIEPVEPAMNFSQQPVWMEDSEQIHDEEVDEAIAEGMEVLVTSLKRGYKGLKVLIRKFRS